MRGPIRQFRVYPEGKSLYYTVVLYPDLRSMRKAYAQHRQLVSGSSGSEGHTMAACSAVTRVSYKGGCARVHPNLGRIFFAFSHNGAGIVAHEAAHAARYYFQRMGLRLEDDRNDERFAYAVSGMVSDIGRRIW